MQDYQKQATDFLAKTGVKLTAKFIEDDFYFPGDKETRDIYRITLKRDKIRRSFTINHSSHSSVKTPPTAYDVLTCLQKYDVGTFENFCGEFGYDEDSRTAERTYKAVLKEYQMVCDIWTSDEIEQLAEIQ